MVTTDILVSTLVMSSFLPVVTVAIQRVSAWRGHMVAVRKSGMSTVDGTDPVTSEANTSKSFYTFRFILEMALWGSSRSLVEVTMSPVPSWQPYHRA